jgi:nicotinamidase-related amidase
VLLDDSSLSDIVDFHEGDRIIRAGINESDHYTDKKYPDNDFILNQLYNVDRLVIAGFHHSSCVDELAIRASNRNLDCLIDEDLTDHFKSLINTPGFKINSIASYNFYNFLIKNYQKDF